MVSEQLCRLCAHIYGPTGATGPALATAYAELSGYPPNPISFNSATLGDINPVTFRYTILNKNMTTDPSAGTITVSAAGIYLISWNIGFYFDKLGEAEICVYNIGTKNFIMGTDVTYDLIPPRQKLAYSGSVISNLASGTVLQIGVRFLVSTLDPFKLYMNSSQNSFSVVKIA